jgi:hypothetical protein
LGADKDILKEEFEKKPKAAKKLPKKQFKKSYLKYSEENVKILRHFRNYIGEYDLKEVFPIENDQDTLGKEIHKILSEVPLILSLHYSFWENPLFLKWQILRLNKKYQETTLKMWGPLINWIEQEIPGGVAGFDPSEPNPKIIKKWQREKTDIFNYTTLRGLQKHIFALIEVRPNPGENFSDWNDRLSCVQDMYTKLLNITDLYCNSTQSLLTNDDSIFNESQKQIIKNYFKYLDILPIPYQIRFPLPFILKKMIPKFKKGQGTKANWARNLLFHELLKKIYKMDISRLFYEDNIQHPYRGKSGQNLYIARIGRIEKTISKTINAALPIS